MLIKKKPANCRLGTGHTYPVYPVCTMSNAD